MKKLPILILLLMAVGIPLAHADIIPPGQKVVTVCAKITNIADFPKLIFVMVNKTEDQTMSQTVLDADSCISSTGKYEWYDIFAVDSAQYVKSQPKAGEYYIDPNAYPVMTVDGYDAFLSDTDKTETITRYYSINGVDNTKKYASATRIKSETNLGTTNFAPIVPANMEDHINLDSPVFSDVNSKSQYYNALSYLRKNGIVDGYDDGSFRAGQPINRAEFVKILFAYAMGKDYIPDCKSDLYTDVVSTDRADPWYYKYVCYATDVKAISGYEDGTFKPGQNIIFSEAAKIISKGEYLDQSTSASDPWYKNYVDDLATVNSIPQTITSFDQQITRGEMAEMIYRIQAGIKTLPSMAYSDLK